MEALRAALGGGDDDEFVEKLARSQLSYMAGTLVGLREFNSMINGYTGYSGPAGTRFFSEAGKLAKQAEQGEIDEALIRSLNQVGGIVFHYPATQIDKTVRGMQTLATGQEKNPAAIFMGPSKK
jgi:hypothetical protein